MVTYPGATYLIKICFHPKAEESLLEIISWIRHDVNLWDPKRQDGSVISWGMREFGADSYVPGTQWTFLLGWLKDEVEKDLNHAGLMIYNFHALRLLGINRTHLHNLIHLYDSTCLL